MDAAQFVRANSTNLPSIDTFMLMEFMRSNDKYNVAEIRGVKALLSSRESYVETAVGYVEVKRANGLCQIQAKIVPEHKISSKYYVTSVKIDENNAIIQDTACEGCAAAAGGCKHTLVLLYWLQKRSTEPSPTSVQCYWTKPRLSCAQQEIVTCSEIFKTNQPIQQVGPKDPTVLEKFRSEAMLHAGCSKSLIQMYGDNENKDKLTNYCVFDLMVDFCENETDHSFENFKLFSNYKVAPFKQRICSETISQANSKLWHCMRQGRITGSKIYEIAQCHTSDGSLVEELLGGYKIHETKAMKRGKNLEKDVLNTLNVKLGVKIEEAGFYLVDGIFGASPDGVGDDFVVEIKCPISEKTKKNYVCNDNISKKCIGQIQLEMLAAGKSKCLFCIADPKFEQNGEVDVYTVMYDTEFTKKLMSKAERFWKTNLFPKIYNSAHNQ